MEEFDDSEDYEKLESETVKISIPTFKRWNIEQFYDYKKHIFDYEKIAELTTATDNARIALFEINEKINSAERKEKMCKVKYERAHRREYLKASNSTEAKRKAYADLQTEHLEDDVIVYEQVRMELVRASNTVRLELQMLQSVGNNLRQLLKME